MNFKQSRGDEGFTLVELIMVIVIVGILASVAVPKFIDLTGQAQKAKCLANQGAINSAFAMQYADVVASDPSKSGWMENKDGTISSAGAWTYTGAGSEMTPVIAASWFATGSIPHCSTTGTLTVTNGVVTNCDAGHNP